MFINKFKHPLKLVSLGFVFLTSIFSLQITQAKETIKLTIVSGYPPAVSWVKATQKVYIPNVDTALAKTGNYKIFWNQAFSGQIVRPRGELEGIENGLGDLGIVPTVFHADKVPLYNFPFVTPFSTRDMDLVANTYVQLEKQFDQFSKTWNKFNQINLSPAGAVDNYMVFSRNPISTLSQMKGMKIGAAGPNLPWIKAVGATGVNTSLTDMYMGLNTRLFDGVIMYGYAAGAFKLCEPASNVMDASIGATSGFSLNINKDVWASLPTEVKAALRGATEAWRKEITKITEDGATTQLALCKEKWGLKTTTLSKSDRTEWASMIPNLAKKLANDLDAKGQPGTKVLSAYMNALRSANQPIARDWDRE
jgi:TRAP-type C4-dicarboxylate transport system substrate-binding protein